ncbi:hypothetical protein Ae201684P_021605 [Aphanomyces euteiches]|nr:hypothetical protein Ae201684P_021605 [Aphanomyces euteiches]
MSSMEAAAIDEAPWDIQADLSFLFDSSNITVAGDVSTKVKSGSVDAVQSKLQPRGNPSEARQRAKRMELLREIEILTKQLADIKRKTCITEDMTRWKNVARRLRCESQKAVKDRRSLLEAIHANELFIAKMTALARKKPTRFSFPCKCRRTPGGSKTTEGRSSCHRRPSAQSQGHGIH